MQNAIFFASNDSVAGGFREAMKKLFAVLAFLTMIAAGAIAQEDHEAIDASSLPVDSSQGGSDPQFRHSEIGLQVSGTFPKETNGNGIRQNGTNATGFLGSYRYHLNKWHAVEVDYGYTRNSQNYATPFGPASIQTNVHEFSASYVLSLPRFLRLTPYVSAGTGALVFSPTDEGKAFVPNSDTQAKATFVYGAGVDYSLSQRLALRVGYRGLVFNAPDFDVRGLDTGAITHIAEPTAGFVFHF
jgi:opacity protein-like surface antigen